MANIRSHTLSSDPNFLLSLISEIGDESESEDEFDGWLGPDDGPVAFRKEDGGDNTYSPPSLCDVRTPWMLAHDL